MSGRAGLGPGTLRVGRFIGRLGVVSLPAVEAGLDLDQRVVRRHVAKLEGAGWLARAPWVWGEGSVVWLTGVGVQGAGLGGVRAVKSPPGPTTIAHGVLVGFSAARAEHRGRTWKSARELELDREPWAAPMRCDRGYTEQLPDLAIWLEQSNAPGAVIAENGGRREDRQKMILEGWRDAVWSGRYLAVRYDCASPSVARWITRLAKKVGLTNADFTAVVQTTAEQIAALPPPPTTTRPQPSTRPSRRGHPARRPRQHQHKRRHPGKRCKSRRPSRRRHRSPRRTRPRRSASDVTARSSEWTNPSPAADGAADAQPAIRPGVAARRCGPPIPQSQTTATKSGLVLKRQRRTHDQDRRLAPAPAIDLAALGEDHATGPGARHPAGRHIRTSYGRRT
jgi:hypothetical protein